MGRIKEWEELTGAMKAGWRPLLAMFVRSFLRKGGVPMRCSMFWAFRWRIARS